MDILKFIKNWALPLAMVAGAIGFPVLVFLMPLTPYLVFFMLLLTFCRIPLHEIRFKALHFWLVLLQVGGGIAIYFATASFNVLVAEGAIACMLAPTATSAAVITEKLGGNPASLTAYVILSNLATAISVPILFPIIHPMYQEVGFWSACFKILIQVLPLLMAPLITALLLHRFFPRVHKKMAQTHELSFYLWAIALMIVMAQATHFLIYEASDASTKTWIALGTLVVCCMQFFIGKKIGSVYKERITGGQALGQKNTILAVWMAYTYLTPISAVGAGAYVVWQNVINSSQLWIQRRRLEKGLNPEKE